MVSRLQHTGETCATIYPASLRQLYYSEALVAASDCLIPPLVVDHRWSSSYTELTTVTPACWLLADRCKPPTSNFRFQFGDAWLPIPRPVRALRWPEALAGHGSILDITADGRAGQPLAFSARSVGYAWAARRSSSTLSPSPRVRHRCFDRSQPPALPVSTVRSLSSSASA